MNWAQFKDLHCFLCLHGAVVACWFITQEAGGSNKNNFYRSCRFFRIHLGKTRIHCCQQVPTLGVEVHVIAFSVNLPQTLVHWFFQKEIERQILFRG